MEELFVIKVGIVTGGVSGIGRATALALAREGARVTVAGLDSEGGEETAAAIRPAGGEAIFFKTDVTSGADSGPAMDGLPD